MNELLKLIQKFGDKCGAAEYYHAADNSRKALDAEEDANTLFEEIKQTLNRLNTKYKIGDKLRFADESGGLMTISGIRLVNDRLEYIISSPQYKEDYTHFLYSEEIYTTKEEALKDKELGINSIHTYLVRE